MRCKAGKFVFLVFASFLILMVGVSGARAFSGGGAFSVDEMSSSSELPVMDKGIWIWKIWEIENGNLSKIIERLKSAGVKWVSIKLGDSNSYWPGHDPSVGSLSRWLQENNYSDFSEVVTEFHNAGIKVLGWHYVYSYARWSPGPGYDIRDTEAEVSIEILNISGIDGLIINAEAEYEGKGKGPIAEQYMKDIRDKHPNSFIAYSSFARVTGHEWFPWLEFGRYCDANMPQCYWAARPLDPEEEVRRMKEDFDHWHSIWEQKGYGDSVKPIIPVGQGGYVDIGRDIYDGEIKKFCDKVQEYGYQGVSLYRYDIMDEAAWKEYASSWEASPRIITVGHTPGADYWFIQDAINAAKDGDIIEVWYGTYNEHIVINKSITLRSRDGVNMTSINGKGGGTIVLISADNVTITNFTIENGGIGIKIESNNTVVCNNVITNMGGDPAYGIYLDSSIGAMIYNNDISNVNGVDKYCEWCRGGSAYGIYLSSSSCTLSNNMISSVNGGDSTYYDDWWGVGRGYGGSAYGIYLYSSSSSILSNNIVSNIKGGHGTLEGGSGYGICLSSSGSNTITSNTIKSVSGRSGYGFYLTSGSVMNVIYHNNIIDCSTKGGYDSAGSNAWDAGPIKRGNYWSDYKGNDTDNDGIGDTPYELAGGAGSKDYYPFMNESGWLERENPSVSISTDKYEYRGGDKMLISISLGNPTDELQDLEFLWRLNIPDYGLSFPVISNKSLSLPPGFKKTFVIPWTLPNLSVSFNASWYVALYSDGVISEDTADWRYVSATKKGGGEREIAREMAEYLREIERSALHA